MTNNSHRDFTKLLVPLRPFLDPFRGSDAATTWTFYLCTALRSLPVPCWVPSPVAWLGTVSALGPGDRSRPLLAIWDAAVWRRSSNAEQQRAVQRRLDAGWLEVRKQRNKSQNHLKWTLQWEELRSHWTHGKYKKDRTSGLHFDFPAVPTDGLTDEPCWGLKWNFLFFGIASDCNAAHDLLCFPFWHLCQLWRWLQFTLGSEWCWFQRMKKINPTQTLQTMQRFKIGLIYWWIHGL